MLLTRSLELLLACMALAIVLGAARLWQGDFPLQSNLLALLPDGHGNEASRAASNQLSSQLENDFIFFIAGPDSGQVIEAARHAGQLIDASPLLQRVSPQDELQQRLQYIETLKQHRFYLLLPTQIQQLETTEHAPLLQEAIQGAYSLTASSAIASLAEDPLGLFNHYIAAQEETAPAAQMIDDIVLMTAADRSYAVLHGRAIEGAFNLDAQQTMSVLEDEIAARLERTNSDLKLLRAGAIFHASRAAATAKQEVTLIGVGSALGILLLFLMTFRSIFPLLLSIVSIAFGCLFALVLSWNLFGSLHLLTLVFGASLIGVAVDYSLHFLTRAQHSSAGLPGLGLAIMTSVVGYGSLLQADVPGLREMAVFSITGLIASGLFVRVVFPRLRGYSGQVRASPLLKLSILPTRLWQQRRLVLVVALVLVLGGTLSQLQLTNDIRVFHTPDPQLLKQQAEIESLVPGPAPNQFFLLQGESIQAVLQLAEAFRPTLEKLTQDDAIKGYSLISDSLPSLSQQQQNHALLENTVYAPGAEAEQFFTQLGFEQDVLSQFQASLEQATPLTLDVWLANAPAQMRLMWLGEHKGQYYAIALLAAVRDIAALQQAARVSEAVSFVDTVAAISHHLEVRTQHAWQLLILAYLMIGILLLLRYRQFSVLKLLLIPLFSSLATVAVVTGLGMSLSLFHIFGLYLVLGLGMDYGIFLRESGAGSQSCLLAILLSVGTSSLSFGLLALSSTPMIAAFGLTVMLGGLGNWILAPLATQDRHHRDGAHK